MTVPSGGDLGAAADRFGGATTELRRWAIGTLLGLLWCAALLIGWRRLAGSIDVPLSPVWLLCAGGLTAMAAAAVRLVATRFERRVSLPATAAVLILGVGLSLRGTSAWGLAAFWSILLGGELWAWRPAAWRRPRGPRDTGLWRRLVGNGTPQPGTAGRASSGTRLQHATSGAPPADDTGVEAAAVEAVPGEAVLQQLTRCQAADGGEEVRGWLRTPLAAGQRTAVAHLAFCPQFAKTPELTVEQTDGPAILRINKAVFPFGARIDLKLAAAAEEPLDVLLRFSARSKPPGSPTTASTNTP